MTLQPIVPARPRPRPARCAELTDAHQSPPVEADFGPSHDAITAELLDLTGSSSPTPALQSALNSASSSPTTVSTPSPASAPSSTAYSSAPHGTTDATHTATEHHQDQQVGQNLAPTTRVRTAQVGPKLLPTWGQKSGSGPHFVIVSTPVPGWVGGQLARRTRLRGSSNPARPYICRLIILMRFTDPSTAPELFSRVRPLSTAS